MRLTTCGTEFAGYSAVSYTHLDVYKRQDQAPMAHVFWDTHVDWAAVDPGDGLPRKPAPEVD